VTVHSAPLRDQGTWAEQHIAAAEHVAVLPPGVPFEAAAALPVPALTADQVIGDALQIRAGQTVLVHGAGGVTGGMLVQLAVHRAATGMAVGWPQSPRICQPPTGDDHVSAFEHLPLISLPVRRLDRAR
jgi:NADPH:quinone reductase-like Zn-dependent oxidoreductase